LNGKKLSVIGAAFVGLLLAGAIFVSAADQNNANISKADSGTERAAQAKELRDAIKQAVADNDFEAFRKAFEGGLEAKFNKMVESHQKQKAVTDAINSGNYNAWVAAMDEKRSPMAQKLLSRINEQNFSLLKDLLAAREAGEKEKMKEISSELGLDARGMGMGVLNGMKNGIEDGHKMMKGMQKRSGMQKFHPEIEQD